MEIPESATELMRWILSAQIKVAEDWTRERGLTVQQGLTIGYLVDHPGAMQRDIAAMSRTTAASVSSLLQGLERRGLIERRTEPGDDRSKRVHPTDEARAMVAGFHEALAELEADILAPLDEAERTALTELLTKVARQLPAPDRT